MRQLIRAFGIAVIATIAIAFRARKITRMTFVWPVIPRTDLIPILDVPVLSVFKILCATNTKIVFVAQLVAQRIFL